MIVEPSPAPLPAAPTQSGLTEREQRVERILDLMCRGLWLPGWSDKQLAAEWGCVPDNARHIAAEASRRLRAMVRHDVEAQKDALAELLQTFRVIRARGMANGDAQSLRVALDASRALGFYIGVEPAKKLDVTQRDTAFMDGWTPQEKLAYSTGGESARRQVRAAHRHGVLPNGSDDSSGMH